MLNRRYLGMYRLSPEIVKPGCSLRRLIDYRKETRLFAGEVDSYVKNILDAMAQGKSLEHYVKASDGRIVLAKNEPLPGGGWVSTHEDVTEQCRAEQERAAIRDQEERRANIDPAIASFRPTTEKLLSTVSESATAMRSTPPRKSCATPPKRSITPSRTCDSKWKISSPRWLLAKAALRPAQLRKRESRHGFLILTAPLGSPLARGRADTREIYAWLAAVLPSAACAAARRAIGTRKGEQDT